MRSKTKLELLNNTAARYNINTRAVNVKGCCSYITEDGKKCAIGAEVRNPSKLVNGGVLNDYVFSALPKRLQKMGLDFLSDIQSLHDKPINWNERGLSEKGSDRFEQIKSAYNL